MLQQILTACLRIRPLSPDSSLVQNTNLSLGKSVTFKSQYLHG